MWWQQNSGSRRWFSKVWLTAFGDRQMSSFAPSSPRLDRRLWASHSGGRHRWLGGARLLSLRPLPLRPRQSSSVSERIRASPLLEHPGDVVSKQVLVDEVWNGTAVTDSSLSEVVRILRQTLGDDPQNAKYIQTLHGRGFRFVAPVSAESPSHREETARLDVGTDESLEKEKVFTFRKDPHRRSRDMTDVRREEAHREPTTVLPMEAASASQPGRWRGAIPWSFAGTAAVIAGVAVWSLTHWSLTRPPPPTLTKFVITPPPNAPLADTNTIDLAIFTRRKAHRLRRGSRRVDPTLRASFG